MGQKQQETKNQASQESSRQPASEGLDPEGLAFVLADTLKSTRADRWPNHSTAASIRQATVLQMQRRLGNARVQAMLSDHSESAPSSANPIVESHNAPQLRLSTSGVQLFPGSRAGRGYRYGGGRSAGYTRAAITRAIGNFERDNHTQLADACRVFLELAPMEGWISAINTWDSQIFTWGAGFAQGGMLSTLWRNLDSSVKSYLGSHAQARTYFAGGSLNISEAIRTDTGALDAVVHVSENDPYRTHVLRAQLRTFMERTMGVANRPTRGTNFATRDVRVLSLAAHLRHWTPALFDMPGDLTAAVGVAGGGPGKTADPVAIAAAVIRSHAQHMLTSGRFGENRPGRRRVLKASMARSWNPVMRYERNLQRLFPSLALPSEATTILPAFQNSSSPFFNGSNRLTELPESHYIMKKGATYYDFGPRS